MDGSGKKTHHLSRSCFLLIVLAGVERFAFKGVASNLVTYLTQVVKMSTSAAAKTVNSWCGFTSLVPLLLAPIADSCSWDRYSTILASGFIYLLGLAAVTSSALANTWSPSSSASSSPFLFWSLCLISIGLGAYNPSLQAFGADQLDKDDDEEFPCIKDDHKSNRKSLFFQYWYVGVCVGSLLGVTLLSYIQDTFGWVLGFMIPTIAMATSAVFFSCWSRVSNHQLDGSSESKSLYDLITGLKATVKRLMTRKITLPEDNGDTVELELQETPLCCQKFDNCENADKQPSRGKQLIANLKIVLRLLPIWTMLLMFAVIFQQPATFFTKQGMTMKRNLGKFMIPPATLQSAITLSIILLMPLYDKILIPAARMITGKDKGITVMQRIGIGMFLSIIAMLIAAFVEMKRLEISRKMNPFEHAQQPQTVPLSIFWLLPQYILLGISDIFTVVGMQEFFYNEVPVQMRTMGFALYTSVFGAGSFLSAFLIYVIEMISSEGSISWFSDDMREARLDKYYWVLSISSALSLILYLILCKFFKSRTDLDNDS